MFPAARERAPKRIHCAALEHERARRWGEQPALGAGSGLHAGGAGRGGTQTRRRRSARRDTCWSLRGPRTRTSQCRRVCCGDTARVCVFLGDRAPVNAGRRDGSEASSERGDPARPPGLWRCTPRTSCSTRASAHRPARPEPASAPGPAPRGPLAVPPDCGAAEGEGRAPCPPRPAGLWARPRAGRTRRAAARTRVCSPAIAQLRVFAYAPPLPLLPSLPLAEKGGRP